MRVTARTLFIVGTAAASAYACGEVLENNPPTQDPSSDGGGQEATTAEATDACATATWVVHPDGVAPLAIASDPSGRLFAAGQLERKAWLAELDRCTGRTIRETDFELGDAGDAGTSFQVAIATADEIIVGGSTYDPTVRLGEPLYVRFDLATLKPKETRSFPTVAQSAAFIESIELGADNSVWLAGSRGTLTDDANGIVIHASGQPCLAVSLGRSVVGIAPRNGGGALIGVISSGLTNLANVNDQCEAGAGIPAQVPEGGTPFQLREKFGTLYIVGAGPPTNANGSSVGYVAMRDANNSWTLATLDPNEFVRDVVARIDSDGVGVYLGMNLNDNFLSALPTVYRFPAPLPAGDASKPSWVGTPFGSDLFGVEDLSVAPGTNDDAVFVVVARRGNARAGGIARCSKVNGCRSQ